MPGDKELIILAAARAGDPYCSEVARDVVDFHVAYAKQIMQRDDVLILTDPAYYDVYAGQLGEKAVLLAP